MKQHNKFNRGEAAALAIALAIAGTLALLNQILPLWGGEISWAGLLHASPYLLVTVGLSLLVAEEQAETVVSSPSVIRQKEGRYER
ncbi:MAG TPA: hypothetical protein VH088_22355 [Terriglobales bacterium]|jgi:hypothetical protein|nr:hypothetical protein [Terriglobales bacterium]